MVCSPRIAVLSIFLSFLPRDVESNYCVIINVRVVFGQQYLELSIAHCWGPKE